MRTIPGRRLARRSMVTALPLALAAAGAAPLALAQDVCTGVSPVSSFTLSAFPVVTGLTGLPLDVQSPPGDTDRLFVVEQSGLIRIHRRGDPPGTTSIFLDLTGVVQAAPSLDEMGLLGLAFDPDYAANGRFYVNYTEGPLIGPYFTVVARYERSDVDPDSADPTETRLLRFQQPQANHNGGQLFFGNDGFLYVGSGDGGSGGDPHGLCGNGQNRTSLLGKLLRLDVRDLDPASVPPDCGGAAAPYRIPSGNPFALTGTSECGEIFAYGLRNPWRSTVDPATSDLYVADVGQNCYEEINVLPGGAPAGANFGWRQMEAAHCFQANAPTCEMDPVACAGSPPCDDPSLTLPIHEYPHVGNACSVTGGHVYRGCQMPSLAGRYFYGDYCEGFVHSFRFAGGAATDPQIHTDDIDPGHTLAFRLTSFGRDAQGEIYITNRSGTVLRIAPRFTDLEVSGPGAGTPFLLGGLPWTWEDLAFTSMQPVNRYRVYRGQPNGPFQCRFNSPTPSLAGGDPEDPPLGGMFAYVVTAVSPTGQETRPGIAGTSFLQGGCQ
jgi:glucose/arabinose dehydrogenase